MIEAVGRPETYKQAFYARDLAGRVVLVGVPSPEMKLELPLLDVFGRGGSLKSSYLVRDCLPSRDFPMLVSHYKQGNLDLDAFVTERITIDQVEEAFEKMHEGTVLRSVVEIHPTTTATASATASAAETADCDGGVRAWRQHRKPRRLRHVLPRRRHLGGGRQRLDRGQRHRMRDHRLPARRGGGGSTRSAAGRWLAILLTHARDDHIGAARQVADTVGAPIPPAPPRSRSSGNGLCPAPPPIRRSRTGTSSHIGGATLKAIHTPGHSPGSTCFHRATQNTVFSGDTLFNGGPGATGRSYSDYPTILTSIRERLLTLPPDTIVHTGHGDNTTIAAERETLAKVNQ